jgi:hypothetical protein
MVPCTDTMKETEPPAATLTEFGERMESTMGTDGAGGVGVEDGDAAVALNGTTTGSELTLVRIDKVPVTVPGLSPRR